MPARRRGQEAKRAANRQARLTAEQAARSRRLNPQTIEDEIEAAYYDNGPGSACCIDCSPGYFRELPEFIEAEAREQVALYLATRRHV